MASHCEGYCALPGISPSLPNYIWLEAGTNFGIFDDNDPTIDHLPYTNHLVTQLRAAGISWKSYQEHISGTNVPLVTEKGYSARHHPFVYFDDVTGTNDPNYAYGIAHIRPYPELATDLANNTVARYNFITPDDCHDMHTDCYPVYNGVRQGDNWLAAEVPKILASQAYQNGGALFITWDESFGPDEHLGMIVLSPFARGHGYSNNIYYTHSSTLRTFQTIFGVSPWLGDAANATDLRDLFILPWLWLGGVKPVPGGIQISATGVTPGKTNWLLASSNLQFWTTICTNVPTTNWFTVVDTAAANLDHRYYRLVQLP